MQLQLQVQHDGETESMLKKDDSRQPGMVKLRRNAKLLRLLQP